MNKNQINPAQVKDNPIQAQIHRDIIPKELAYV